MTLTSAERTSAYRARRAERERDTVVAFLHSLTTWDFIVDELDPALLPRDFLVEALRTFADEAEAAYWEVRDGNDNALSDYEAAVDRWTSDLVKWQLRRANAIAAGRRLNSRRYPEDARPTRPTRPTPESWELVARDEGYPTRPVAVGPRRAVALLRELGPELGLREVRRSHGRYYAFTDPAREETTMPPSPLTTSSSPTRSSTASPAWPGPNSARCSAASLSAAAPVRRPPTSTRTTRPAPPSPARPSTSPRIAPVVPPSRV
ncbi:hypothetical protein [Microbacterium aureliae]